MILLFSIKRTVNNFFYLRDESTIVYQTKNTRQTETCDALEWLAAMCSHVPNRGEKMIRYDGYYSNVTRGKWKKDEQDNRMSFVMEAAGVSPEKRKAWARLIQKIGAVD